MLALAAVGAAVAFWWWRMPVTPPPVGIPFTLAAERAARVSNLKYAVTLQVPAERQAAIRGHVTATFELNDARRPLLFDFAQPTDHLHTVSANGRVLTPEIVNGHIAVPRRALRSGTNSIEFDFTAGDASLNRDADFLYSLFVPARASLALPCFDQPDLKARWTLSLDVPKGWTAVANGREAGRTAHGDRLGLTFDETAPLSTYLFAFAAGRFNVEVAERNGRFLRMFHRETDAAKVARNRDAIFDQHAHALAWMENYTGIPYPFGKFDFVLIPAFQFGGMEHPGAIYYNANTVMLDESATQAQALARANVIAHETAHMWFGDLVTMRWFNDVWMKEVFANFMAAKIVNPSFPTMNHDLRFLLQNVPVAYDVDRTDGANPIRQDLANLSEAGSLYGAIIYQKAPVVMRQLERLLGADAFQAGLRNYLSAHAFGNADWTDLVERLDRLTPIDLAEWSRAWVSEPGRPTITTDLQTANGRITRLSFHQSDSRGRGLVWPESLQVLVGSSTGIRPIDLTLNATDTIVPEAVGLPMPTWVLPVGQGLGYGDFELDPATQTYLSTHLHDIRDPLTRGAALVVLWESMLDGRVAPADLFRQLVVALPIETNELNLQQMLDDVRVLFWRFTTPDERIEAAAGLERMLRAGLGRARTTSEKAAWFGAIRSVALSPETVTWLEQVWRHQTAIPGLPLAEVDEAELAADLALRDVEDADAMLNEQQIRFRNPDRRARFSFIRPALSRDGGTRDRFFESLRDVKMRAREAWVIDAARYLHHPLRASTSRRYIRPALDLLAEIQRTGDIFFPKRWADATLSGYQSIQTAADVREFIAGLPPDYPVRLRWVLLSSADPLFRAARLQQQ